MESPLLEIDPVLEAFADKYQLTLTKNHKWPERSISWGDPVRRLLQIYPQDEKHPAYNLWLCASEDRVLRQAAYIDALHDCGLCHLQVE